MSIMGRMFGFVHNETYNRGIRLYDQGQYEKAIEEFTKLTDGEASGDPITLKLANFYLAEAWAQIGQTGIKHGSWTEAADAYQKSLEFQPQYADLHYYRAVALRRMHRTDEALIHLSRALEINRRFAKAAILNGIILYEIGRRDEGIARIREAVGYKPELKNGRFERAMEYHAKGDVTNAIGAFETIAATESDDVLFHAKLADDLYRQRHYEQAVEEYKKAISINPRYADVRNHCGMALQAMGKATEAIEEFRAAVSINAKYIEAYVNLATALRSNGDERGAREVFEKALEVDPENPIAKANLTPV